MSLPRYPKYKNSGVAWLGEVPEHWQINALRHDLDSIFNGLTADQIDEGENTVPVTRIETISKGIIDLDKVGYISTENARGDRQLAKGDILFSNINSLAMIGNCARYHGDTPLFAGMNLLVLRPNKSVDGSWLFWLIRATVFRQVVESLAKPAINQASISQSAIRGISIGVPSLEEQDAIAIFLDRETRKIDALVEEQRRLIELLKEKRQAVISHAVTKGLNPDAPIKDSGIEWLGQIPAHWTHLKLKFLARKITDGAHVSPETEGGEFFFVSTKDITDTGIDFSEAVLTSSESYSTLVNAGCKPEKDDVLFSKDGSIGKTIVVRESLEFVVASSLIIISPDKDQINSQFLHFLCQSSSIKSQVESFVKGAGLPRLSIQNLLRVQTLRPPIPDQIEIVGFLNRETARTDALIEEASSAIDILKERRTAIISAAVTGKIDVRSSVKEDAA